MEHAKPEETRWVAPLAAITILAFALRLYGLSAYSIWYDESTTLYALRFIDWDLTFLRGGAMRLIPLYPFILFFWHGLLTFVPGLEMGSQLSDFLLRLLSLFFGVLTVPLTFYVGRHLTRNSTAALIAALMLAISPFHIYYAQELRPHTLYVLLVLAAQVYAFRALEEDRIKLWIAAVAFSSLSFYAYYFSAFYMVAINLYVLVLIAVYRPQLKRWIVSQLCLGLTLVPALLMALFVFQVYQQAEEFWFPKPDLLIVGITLKNYFAGYSPQAAIYWPLFLLACAALFAGVWALRNRPRAALFLVIMSLGPLLVQVAFWSTQEFAFYTYRAQIAYSPTVYILAGAGLAWLRPRWIRAAALLLFLALTTPLLADHYAQRIHPIWGHRIGARYKPDVRSAAEYIRENMRKGDFVAHSSTYTLGPFRYHYLDTDQAYIGFTDQEYMGHLKSFPDEKIWESIGFIPRRIEEVSPPGQRVWYVRSWWEPDDPAPITREIRAWYDANAVRIDQHYFDGVMVYLFDRDPALRASTRTHWVADFGRQEIPLYDFADGQIAPEALIAWRESFTASFPPEPSRRGFLLDVWFDLPDESSDPQIATYEANAYTARIRIANRLPETRTVALRAFEAEDVIRALSLEREPDSDVWRPQHTHLSKIAYRATLSQDVPSGRLSGTVTLAPGTYGLYALTFLESGRRNHGQGLLRINTVGAHGERHPVGEVRGHDPQSTAGWDWRYVGQLESNGSPVELELIADNVDNLPQAEFELDRLMFVDIANSNAEGPKPFWTDEETLAPMSETTVELRGVPPLSSRRRIYIEIVDDDPNVFRSLAFDVQPNYKGDQN